MLLCFIKPILGNRYGVTALGELGLAQIAQIHVPLDAQLALVVECAATALDELGLAQITQIHVPLDAQLALFLYKKRVAPTVNILSTVDGIVCCSVGCSVCCSVGHSVVVCFAVCFAVCVHRNPFPCAALVFKNRLLGLANFLGGTMGPFFTILIFSYPPFRLV